MSLFVAVCTLASAIDSARMVVLQGARGGVEMEEAGLLNKLLDGWTQIDQSLPFYLVHLEP